MASSSSIQGKASISIRRYIYIVGRHPLQPGLPRPYSTQLAISNPLNNTRAPSEPTSTLVLTSPGSTFVDIRIFKPTSDDMPELPNTGGPASRVDWAFGGISYSEPYNVSSDDASPTVSTGPSRRALFVHTVSTRHRPDAPPDSISADEGDMYPVSATRELEVGIMWNRETLEFQVYEEMWEDVEMVPVNEKHVAVVLRLDTRDNKARGIIVRVDGFCQGILRVEDQWVIERWEFQAGSSAKTEESGGENKEDNSGPSIAVRGGGWKRTVRVGDMFLPCAVTFQPGIILEGGNITHKGAEWTVQEVAEWD